MSSESSAHSWLEDIAAIVVGCSLMSVGLAILHAAGLVTGGMAGLALLVVHFVPLGPGPLFALLNLPFLMLSWREMGPAFTLRTLAVSVGIALISVLLERRLAIAVEEPVLAAVVAGVLFGVGALVIVRHGSGLGGVGILTAWFSKRKGWPIGRSQIAVDLAILCLSFSFLNWGQVGLSALSAIIMGAMVWYWHRTSRYLGYSL